MKKSFSHGPDVLLQNERFLWDYLDRKTREKKKREDEGEKGSDIDKESSDEEQERERETDVKPTETSLEDNSEKMGEGKKILAELRRLQVLEEEVTRQWRLCQRLSYSRHCEPETKTKVMRIFITHRWKHSTPEDRAHFLIKVEGKLLDPKYKLSQYAKFGHFFKRVRLLHLDKHLYPQYQNMEWNREECPNGARADCIRFKIYGDKAVTLHIAIDRSLSANLSENRYEVRSDVRSLLSLNAVKPDVKVDDVLLALWHYIEVKQLCAAESGGSSSKTGASNIIRCDEALKAIFNVDSIPISSLREKVLSEVLLPATAIIVKHNLTLEGTNIPDSGDKRFSVSSVNSHGGRAFDVEVDMKNEMSHAIIQELANVSRLREEEAEENLHLLYENANFTARELLTQCRELQRLTELMDDPLQLRRLTDTKSSTPSSSPASIESEKNPNTSMGYHFSLLGPPYGMGEAKGHLHSHSHSHSQPLPLSAVDLLARLSDVEGLIRSRWNAVTEIEREKEKQAAAARERADEEEDEDDEEEEEDDDENEEESNEINFETGSIYPPQMDLECPSPYALQPSKKRIRLSPSDTDGAQASLAESKIGEDDECDEAEVEKGVLLEDGEGGKGLDDSSVGREKGNADSDGPNSIAPTEKGAKALLSAQPSTQPSVEKMGYGEISESLAVSRLLELEKESDKIIAALSKELREMAQAGNRPSFTGAMHPHSTFLDVGNDNLFSADHQHHESNSSRGSWVSKTARLILLERKRELIIQTLTRKGYIPESAATEAETEIEADALQSNGGIEVEQAGDPILVTAISTPVEDEVVLREDDFAFRGLF